MALPALPSFFDTYLVNSYWIPDAMLGVGNSAVNTTDMFPILGSLQPSKSSLTLPPCLSSMFPSTHLNLPPWDFMV